jgi:hypothetical protein
MKTPALFGMVPVSLSPTGAGTPHPLLVTIKASNDSAGEAKFGNANSEDPMNEDDMKIPEGKTCESCFHLSKCEKLYGVISGSVSCGWSPSHYTEKVQVNANYGLVELMGRQQIAGFISDAMIEGAPFVKVEVPATKVHRKYIVYFSIESVYGITPIQEAQAANITLVRELGRFHEADAADKDRSILIKGHGEVNTTKGKRVV